jgi:PadR family transcriptional regulator, regulatory protein PadR
VPLNGHSLPALTSGLEPCVQSPWPERQGPRAIECSLDIKSTYIDYQRMPRKPNNSRQTRALLAAFLDRSRKWRHGYHLSKETGLRSGTLYPLLMRLSEQGFLESRWEEAERPGLPPRHVYRLTASGRALAREQELAAIAAERVGALA